MKESSPFRVQIKEFETDMNDTKQTLPNIIGQALAADIEPVRDFLFSNPSEPASSSRTRT